jgi:hypothetical protein
MIFGLFVIIIKFIVKHIYPGKSEVSDHRAPIKMYSIAFATEYGQHNNLDNTDKT